MPLSLAKSLTTFNLVLLFKFSLKVLATHVFNVLAVGLIKMWKQLIGYHLTDESFCAKACASWLRELVKACQDIGLEVMVLVHDMGTTNQAV